MKLEEITREIRCIIETERSAGLAVAEKLLAAKEQFFNDALAWLTWAQKEFRIGRRHSFRLVRAADFFRAMHGMGESASLRHLEIEKLEILSSIPIETVPAFLAEHDAESLDREELREAVNAYLKRSKSQRQSSGVQLDFFSEWKLPAPEKLILIAQQFKGKVNPEKACDYGIVCFSLASRNFKDLNRDKKVHYAKQIAGVISALTGQASDALVQ